jgi:hypothetical protein
MNNLDIMQRYGCDFNREVLTKDPRLAYDSLPRRIISYFCILKDNSNIATTQWAYAYYPG